jgi:hypothetical protein
MRFFVFFLDIECFGGLLDSLFQVSGFLIQKDFENLALILLHLNIVKNIFIENFYDYIRFVRFRDLNVLALIVATFKVQNSVAATAAASSLVLPFQFAASKELVFWSRSGEKYVLVMLLYTKRSLRQKACLNMNRRLARIGILMPSINSIQVNEPRQNFVCPVKIELGAVQSE